MRLVCFAKSRGDAPSTRQRVVGLIEVARSLGWHAELIFVPALPRWNIFPLRWWRLFMFMRILRCADRHTVILLQRTLRCPEFLWLVRRFRSRIPYIVADFDDAVWLHSPKGVSKIIDLADEVWCGSRIILEYCGSRHARARFVPTTVATGSFSLPRNEEKVPVVGWVGDAHAHRGNLQFLAEILSVCISQIPPFRLRLIGVGAEEERLRLAFNFLGDRLDLVSWVAPCDIPGQIARFSIGIMPLMPTAFNAGKSALKLIEYLAAGVPVIASDVGENRHIVLPPAHGLLAENKEEWKSALAVLLSDEARRLSCGAAGQKFVRSTYDRVIIYESLLRELAEKLAAANQASPLTT